MNRITTAPITQAQIAPGPASCAARHAPNSQPEPMIEPSPVNISAHAPTVRRTACSLLMRKDLPGEAVDDGRTGGARAHGDRNAVRSAGRMATRSDAHATDVAATCI